MRWPQIKSFTSSFPQTHPRLDVLINNVAVMLVREGHRKIAVPSAGSPAAHDEPLQGSKSLLQPLQAWRDLQPPCDTYLHASLHVSHEEPLPCCVVAEGNRTCLSLMGVHCLAVL